jgi:hypothetical protein
MGFKAFILGGASYRCTTIAGILGKSLFVLRRNKDADYAKIQDDDSFLSSERSDR